jgi:hypothetical protein
MRVLHGIPFRITLWYLAILGGGGLVLLGGGIYVSLSGVLHRHLDEALKNRDEQVARFRDIVSVEPLTPKANPARGAHFMYVLPLSRERKP